MSLIVLGAGPAGVAAAYRTAGAGHDVVLLEREGHVGGASASFELAGIRVDHGSHRLHRAIDPTILAELRRLLGSELQRRERRGRIRLAERWLPFPLTPAGMRHLPPGFAIRAGFDAVTAWSRTPRADTFAEVVRAGLGSTMLDRFYGPYARKLWGLDPVAISGEQARRRVSAGSIGAVVRRVVQGQDPETRTFLYPRRGFGQTWEALAEAAVERGTQLRLGATATSIALDASGVTVHLDDSSEVHGDQLWSTIPLPVLARLVRPTAPEPVLAAAAALRTRAMLLVYLVLDTPRLTGFDAHYLPEAWTPITRVSEPKNYRDGHPGPHDTGDPADRTVICAELPCHVGDELWTSDDEGLAGLVGETLARSGLPTAPVLQVATRRLPSAYPVYDLTFHQHLELVDRWARSQPQLLTFGRQGLFVHDNSHHALAMAWAAADAFSPDGDLDRASWLRARERFATHVVED